jgi:hypothetical protein
MNINYEILKLKLTTRKTTKLKRKEYRMEKKLKLPENETKNDK